MVFSLRKFAHFFVHILSSTASNLKKIVESIFDYYTDVLNMALNDIIRPDVMKIAEKNDRRELGRLLQLVLGCAINCPLKLDYIRQIMELEESLQRNIMRAIQELDETLQGSLASKNTSLSINNFDTKLIQEDRDRLAQKCHEAANQIALLQEEKSLLQHEVNKLQRDLDRQEGPKTQLIGDDGSSLGPMQPGSTRYNDLRRQLDSLKDELLQTETQRDDFKIRTQQLENDVVMLRLKLDENSVSSKFKCRAKSFETTNFFFLFSARERAIDSIERRTRRGARSQR